MSLQFENCPESFKPVRTVFKSSRQFSNRPDSFQTVRTIMNPSRQCWKSYHLNMNWKIWNCLTCLNVNFEWLFLSYAQKPSRLAETFQTRKNFPGSNTTRLPGFLGLWNWATRICKLQHTNNFILVLKFKQFTRKVLQHQCLKRRQCRPMWTSSTPSN